MIFLLARSVIVDMKNTDPIVTEIVAWIAVIAIIVIVLKSIF